MTANRVRAFVSASIIACSFLSSPSNAAIQQQQETAEQFIERVKKAINKDEWGRAQSGLRHAFTLEPVSPEAHFLAAQVYSHEGACSMAIESLEKALKLQPIFPEAHFLLARSVLAAGAPVRAREEVSTAMAQGTPLFPAYCLLGEIDFAEGKFEAAVASFETALRVSGSGDEKEAVELKSKLDNLVEMIENLRRFAVLETEQSGPDIVRPLLLNPASPSYTQEARHLKVQGAVSMAILVTENGDVDSVLFFRRLGHGLDEQAEGTARNLIFAPATKSGKPIPYWTKLAVEFNLR